METGTHLFLWRTFQFDDSTQNRGLFEDYFQALESKSCKVCSADLKLKTFGSSKHLHMISSASGYDCPLCGWHLGYQRIAQVTLDDVSSDRYYTFSILKDFDINSPQVALEELGSYLRRHTSDIYALTSRRFEELTADVFRAHGYRIVLTPATRDGGADVLVFKHESEGTEAIIECKKYAKERRVGIGLVQRLVGAKVYWKAKRAYLVTTSDFSSIARQSVLQYKEGGYEVELVALADLVSMLKVYNPELPPLDQLTEDMRSELLAESKRVEKMTL